MPTDRRSLIGSAAIAAAAMALADSATGTHSAPLTLQPNGIGDQTAALQSAIARAAQTQSPLVLAPGTYRCGPLTLPAHTHLIGVRGATKLIFTGSASLMASDDAETITLTGLTFDGGSKALPGRRGLLHHLATADLRITDCDIVNANGTGIWLERVSGEIRNCGFRAIRTSGIVSFDARGLLVSQNTLRDIGDNGIEILRHDKGDDGTLVIDNRIENVTARAGGSGQHGNGIVVYKAGNVIVRGNRVSNCDYSGVRGNSSANIQIASNSLTDTREVAIYSEFSFEGAVITGNTVDGAAIGVSVCNFNEGGRLAIVDGNLIRNLYDSRPAGSADGQGGVGIYVEAETAVTGNVIEGAKLAGIMAGWGEYLRNVSISGNIVRKVGIGIGISAMKGAGTALINGNVIAEHRAGAIVGMDHARPMTDDLTRTGAPVLGQIVLGINHIT